MKKGRNPRRPTACSFALLKEFRDNEYHIADHFKRRRKQWYTFSYPGMFPEWPCCYAIYLDGCLVYIGQTENLKIRMQSHGTKVFRHWRDYESITVKAKLSRRFGDWLMTEVRLIRRLQPPYNVRGIASRKPNPCL